MAPTSTLNECSRALDNVRKTQAVITVRRRWHVLIPDSLAGPTRLKGSIALVPPLINSTGHPESG